MHVLVNDKPQRNIYTEHNMICVSDFGIRKICFQSSVSWYYFGVSFFCVVFLFLVLLLSCK